MDTQHLSAPQVDAERAKRGVEVLHVQQRNMHFTLTFCKVLPSKMVCFFGGVGSSIYIIIYSL